MKKPRNSQNRQISYQKRTSGRLTPQEKSRYIHLISKDFLDDLTVAEMASKYGISTASVYRWHRQSDKIQKLLDHDTIKNTIDIDKALNVLCNHKLSEPVYVQEALFQFLAWIRWPKEIGYHTAAMINCITSYIRQKENINSIENLEPEQRSILSKYLTLDVARRFSSPQAAFNPDFKIVTDAKSRYDDRQFYAEIINYLICDNIRGRRGRHRPNLETLQILVDEGAFKPGWFMTARTFEKYWRLRAATYPFLYVEQYHSPFHWSLNPQDDDFAESVDDIISNLYGFQTYLGRVRWVIGRLQEVLDSRAVRRIDFPSLPPQVEAVETDNPELSPGLQAKIKELYL